MFPSRKFCSFFFFLHHFHFECGAHFFFVFSVLFLFNFFFLLLLSVLTRKVGKSTLVFLLFYVFILLLFSYFFVLFFVFGLHSKRLVCLFLFFVFCFLFFAVLFCFIPPPPTPLPLSATRWFPPFFILPRHLSFPLPNTRTALAVPLPLSLPHAPCLFFATFPLRCGRRGVSTLYTLCILFTRKLQVYEAICMRI